MFFEGCRHFLTGGKRAYGFSTTQEFRQVMESVSGQDLTWFIKQWYEGQGHPELKMNWQQRGNEVQMIGSADTHQILPCPFGGFPFPWSFEMQKGRSAMEGVLSGFPF